MNEENNVIRLHLRRTERVLSEREARYFEVSTLNRVKAISDIFIQACANGDLEELQEILTAAQSYYNLDLNCKDQNGKSALVVALETENWACLELLLDNGVKIGDALLYAIKNKQVNAVKILFQKMRPGQGILLKGLADWSIVFATPYFDDY